MDLVGKRIGSYVVQKELGAGGTGTVYLCQHTMIERAVAVKVLHDDQARDPDQVARFFQEAKAAAEIGHPNIISIIDFGHLDGAAGGPPYLMMEALDGMSLDKRLRQGGMSLAEIHHVMTQVCSALVASHGKGIIHRDLKPPNVFLCNRTFDPLFVKVLDFGTAKLTVPALDGHKTVVGMVLGTPAYMSPEQCEGKGQIDHRSDIYSLGVMLYEMLTGTLPFEGEVGEMMLHQLFHAPTPPRERNPSIPPEWEALCLRMMEKAREDRFQSITDLAHALDDLQGHAAAYQAFRTHRAATGKSGHTMIAPAVGGSGDGVVRDAMGASSDSRATVHGSLADFGVRPGQASGASVAPPPVTPPAPVGVATVVPGTGAFVAAPPSSGEYPAVPPIPHPSGDYPAYAGAPYGYPPYGGAPAAYGPSGYGPTDPGAACVALASDPRYAGFPRTLMIRPGGRWYDVFEVCRTAAVAPPASMPLDLALFVTWVEHPHLDPSLAAVVFLSLRTGWSTVVLCARARW